MGWTWGDGILLYGLVRLADALPAATGSRYIEAVAHFHRVWGPRAPRIERADACAPALSALALRRQHGCAIGLPAAARVAAFLSTVPHNRVGAMDHLGISRLRALFPASIWVDTLAMASVFAVQWASYVGDDRMRDFATAQPAIYAAKLLDSHHALFRHAYVFCLGRAVPHRPAFWLRGNGWVLFALVEMLGELASDHPASRELRQLLERVAHALVPWQRDSGAWGSIINDQRSRGETSGTALCAYALARGARAGWLPASMGERARRALAFVVSRIESTSTGLSLRDISAATNPMPAWAYRLVPHVSNASWGVGALFLAVAAAARAN